MIKILIIIYLSNMKSYSQQENEILKQSRVFDPEKYILQYYAKPEGHAEEDDADHFYKFMEKAF